MSRAKKLFARLFNAKRPFKLTRPGWVFILYSIGVGAGAINTGNNLLYIVFGIFLGLLLASGTLSDLSLWGLDVSWIFPSRLRVDERADVWVSVINTKRWWPSLGVSIIFEGLLRETPVAFSVYVPCIRKNETLRVPAAWTPPQRGEFVLKQVRLSTRYPFGLLEKWWRVYRGEPASTVLVGPRHVPVSEHVVWDALAGDDRAAARHARHEGTSSSTVRDYHLGDNPKRIHWRASAKRGGLQTDRPAWLVRQMEPEEQHHVIFEFPSISAVRHRSTEELEEFVRFAASLRERLLEREWNVALFLGEQVIASPDLFFALWDPRSDWARGGLTNSNVGPIHRMNLWALFEHSRREKVAA